MLRHQHLLRPRVETCSYCDLPVVLIDYYGKMLKGCLSCNLWGRPKGRAWTRLPHDDLRTLLASIRNHDSEHS
jgi:hypothetical protein